MTACYIGLLVFDFAILVGTAFLVDQGWSGWWFVFALIVMQCEWEGLKKWRDMMREEDKNIPPSGAKVASESEGRR